MENLDEKKTKLLGHIPIENSDEKKTGEKESWSKNEALALINCYKSRQEEFRSSKRSTHVWENISEDLLCVEVRRSAKSCQIKWKNMVRTYKAVRENFNRTGRGTSKFLYFNEMDDVIGYKHCAVEEIEILEPEYYFESDAGFVDSRIPITNEESTQKRKRGNSRGDFLKLKKALFTKNEYFQRKIQIAEEESKKKEAREERKLLLIQRQLDIEERKVKALEAYLANKK